MAKWPVTNASPILSSPPTSFQRAPWKIVRHIGLSSFINGGFVKTNSQFGKPVKIENDSRLGGEWNAWKIN